MTSKQYISQLTRRPERAIRGKDVPQGACARVLDGLCDVIASREDALAEKDALLASKDAAMAKMNERLLWFERKVFGRSSEKLHPEDPNQLHFDFGEEEVLPLGDEELEATEERVRETRECVRGEAQRRRATGKASQSRKGATYRIGPEVPRQEPVEFYPEGFSPETMTVIGWNRHEYLEIEGPKVSVRVEMEAVCKPAGAKPEDASTPIVEARRSQNCLPGCIAGNKTMATIVTDKWCNHMPEYRQSKRFEAMGLKLSTTSTREEELALRRQRRLRPRHRRVPHTHRFVQPAGRRTLQILLHHTAKTAREHDSRRIHTAVARKDC